MPQVMVVDDSRTQRAVISEYLAELHCDITLCSSGTDALIQVSEHVPDLIILDVEMPGLSGFDTCKAIRGFLQSTWVPIIYLTGRSNPEDIVEGLNVGGDTYISKPVHRDVLTAIAKAMLRLSDIQHELIKANIKLDEVAHFDVLTQIMNRRGYQNILDRYWNDHLRRKSKLTVLLMDIDYFKKYNDNYGHIQGDHCLRQVAQTLKAVFKRPIDIVARYGGEEFVALLPDTDIEGGITVAERIINAMLIANIPHAFSDCQPYLTLSIGIAQANVNHETCEQVLERADKALYAAKEAGRNCERH
jgi:diguanylate cyclase (GGDEF)-like protein